MSTLVHCRVCGGAHERGPVYGCSSCAAILCGAQVNPAAVFHFVRSNRGRVACGRLERLELTNDMRRDRALDAIREGA